MFIGICILYVSGRYHEYGTMYHEYRIMGIVSYLVSCIMYHEYGIMNILHHVS